MERKNNMNKITVNKNSRVLFIGDSITDVKFNSKMRFKIKGKKYTAKTNKKGVATASIKNLKVGKYSISSSYGGCTIKNTIKIKKLFQIDMLTFMNKCSIIENVKEHIEGNIDLKEVICGWPLFYRHNF